MAVLTGAWDKVGKYLNGDRVKKAKKIALRKTLAYFQRQIKLNIQSKGSLAGEPFKENAEYTIEKKKSSKPLIDTGDMLGSIMPHIIDDDSGFVGLKSGKRHLGAKEDNDVADIGMINEFGAVTSWNQVIPARPFIKPILDKFGKDAQKYYEKIFKEEMDK